MATLKFSSVSETTFKPQNPFLCCLALIFIFLVLVHSTSTDSKFNPSSMSSSTLSATQTLIPHSSSSYMDLNPDGKSPNSHKSSSVSSSSREFEAGEHEVPSGPNPISN